MPEAVLLQLIKMIPVIAFFGMPVAIVYIRKYFQQKEKELSQQASQSKLLPNTSEREKQLEARIQNLETIVCSVDFELNQRLNRVAADMSAQRVLATKVEGQAPLPLEMGSMLPGAVVSNRYRIEQSIGQGGMGNVYRAYDLSLNESIALKTISITGAMDPAIAKERFRHEVQLARRIQHPNVVRVHDLVEEDHRLMLTMEYIDGETLVAWTKRKNPVPIADAIYVLGEIASGLAAAHAQGVVHRDLKPQNILLNSDPKPRVKIIDFGLATNALYAGMTATGMILGTAEYMAPEQIRGGVADVRTDVYALGALSHFLIVGRPPFVAETPIAVGFAHVTETPKPLRQIRSDVPEFLENAIMKALAKDPAHRWSSATELRSALGR